MKSIIFGLLLISSFSAFSETIKSFQFAETGPGCAGIGLKMEVKNDKAYLSIYKECLTTSGGRTKPVTHKELVVKDGSVYFYGQFCGYVGSGERENQVRVLFDGNRAECYFDSTDNFLWNKFYLKAKL